MTFYNGTADEHEHEWEPTFRLSRMAGTPHRRCTVTGCLFITLDSDECDCGAFYDCDDCRAWAERMLAENVSPYNGLPFEPAEGPAIRARFANGT
jgi:hypothetical protein